MKFFIKCFIILYLPNLVFNISIRQIIEAKHEPTELSSLEQHHTPDNFSMEGSFERFIRSLLDLLSTAFPERKLTRYCRILNRSLREFDYRATRDLAKHFRYLSRMYREDLKEEIVKYRKEYDKKLHYKTEFLHAMNQLFTLRENLLFSDYIHDLKDYGNEDKLNIFEETHK